MANSVVEITDESGNVVETKGVASALSYQDLNAMINLWGNDQKLQLEMDKLAVRKYLLEHVNQNTVFFHSLKEHAHVGVVRAETDGPLQKHRGTHCPSVSCLAEGREGDSEGSLSDKLLVEIPKSVNQCHNANKVSRCLSVVLLVREDITVVLTPQELIDCLHLRH